MAKSFDELLTEVFEDTDNEPVYLEEAISVPSIIALTAFKEKAVDKLKGKDGKKSKDTAKSKIEKAIESIPKQISKIKAGGTELKDMLRKSAGKYSEIDFKKIIKDNEEQLDRLREQYKINEDDFDNLLNKIVSALKSTDAEKIEKTHEKLRKNLSDEKKDVVDRIFKFFLSRADQQVIKLQKNQKDVLVDIYKKYGKEVVDEIIEFRKEILRPYNLIKRKLKETQTTSAKEKLGLTKREWERAVESGRSKIKKRAKFPEKVNEIQEYIKNERKRLEGYEQLKRMVSKKQDLSQQEVRKIENRFESFIRKYLPKAEYPEFVNGSDVKKYYDELKSAGSETLNNLKKAQNIQDKIEKTKDEFEQEKLIDQRREAINSAFKNYRKQIDRLTGKFTDELQGKYDPNLLAAREQYLFRGELRKQLISNYPNIFKDLYQQMLNDLIKEKKGALDNYRNRLEKSRKSIEFDKTEKMVWGKNKSAADLSGDEDDYYLKIKEEDFEKYGESETQKQPEEVKEARKNINKAIENFKKNMKQKLDDEDYEKLEDNNLFDTVKLTELVSSKELFKDKEEVRKTLSAPPDEGEDDNEDEENT